MVCGSVERPTHRSVPGKDSATKIQDFVEAFRRAQDSCTDPDLAGFLPDPDHPLYHSVLHALIQQDLEAGWRRNQPRRLRDYQRCFPEAFTDSDRLEELVACEYRMRIEAGESPCLNEYLQEYGGAGAESDLPLTKAVNSVVAVQSRPASSRAGISSIQDYKRIVLPCVGREFLGFDLQAQIGQGAFAKVYLAKQRELHERLVVLKVSAETVGEDHVLAQLLHTNVVPIYSIHHTDFFHVVCMPFLGTTTLADVLDEVHTRGLPKSGKYLVNTLAEHRSTRRNSSRRSGQPKPESEPGIAVLPDPEVNEIPASEPGTRVMLKELEGLSYVDAVLWLTSRLADGLGHAHERGILHRDLKPANILLTDEGQPMLLDFNLAEDVKTRATPEAARLGGTLPYMSPEQLRAFDGGGGTLDARTDIYSLGVILFELLTGHFPFPNRSGPTREVVKTMVADREAAGGPPRLRGWNQAISPAVEAIVRRCLEPERDRRYQNIRDLQEDLQRQRDHRPLKYIREPSWRERFAKWRRRHPRLTSLTTVACLATVLVVGLFSALHAYGQRLRRFEAVDALARFEDDLTAVHFLAASQSTDPSEIKNLLVKGDQALARYQVVSDPGWRERPEVRFLAGDKQEKLEANVRTMLLLLARGRAMAAIDLPPGDGRRAELRRALAMNEKAESLGAGDHLPRALWTQRANLLTGLGDTKATQEAAAKAKQMPARNAEDAYLTAREHVVHGRLKEALPLLKEATRQDPQHVPAWFLLGRVHDGLGQDKEAASCYTICVALRPQTAQAYFQRGMVYLRQRDYLQARDDFARVIDLEPKNPDAYFNRALAWRGLNKTKEAIQDLDRALDNNAPYTRVYFLRARLRDKDGDQAGAKADKDEGLKREPNDEQSWNARGYAKLTSDPNGALADFQKGLDINPRSLTSLTNIAHVHETQGKTADAVAMLDRVLTLYPEYVPARSGRGVLLARLGKRDAALEDAKEILKRDGGPAALFRVSGIYAQTSKQEAGDRTESFRLLTTALRKGYGHDLVERDPDLAPLRNTPEFRRLVEAVKVLR